MIPAYSGRNQTLISIMIDLQITKYLKEKLGLAGLNDEQFVEELEKKPLLRKTALRLFNELKEKYNF